MFWECVRQRPTQCKQASEKQSTPRKVTVGLHRNAEHLTLTSLSAIIGILPTPELMPCCRRQFKVGNSSVRRRQVTLSFTGSKMFAKKLNQLSSSSSGWINLLATRHINHLRLIHNTMKSNKGRDMRGMCSRDATRSLSKSPATNSQHNQIQQGRVAKCDQRNGSRDATISIVSQSKGLFACSRLQQPRAKYLGR